MEYLKYLTAVKSHKNTFEAIANYFLFIWTLQKAKTEITACCLWSVEAFEVSQIKNITRKSSTTDFQSERTHADSVNDAKMHLLLLNGSIKSLKCWITSSITVQMSLTHWMMASWLPDIVTPLSVELGSRSPATCTWAPVFWHRHKEWTVSVLQLCLTLTLPRSRVWFPRNTWTKCTQKSLLHLWNKCNSWYINNAIERS